MSMNAMVDIALGLILMYLVLSLICTVINETIASALNLRSKTLSKAITQIIDNPELLKNFNDHGLISSVRNALGRDPSYISGATFATALLDSFNKQQSLVALGANGTLNLAGTANAVGVAIKALPDDSNIKDILLGALPASSTGTLPAGAVGAVPPGGINLDAMRKNLATWFDGAMERVSGDYKNWLQWISFTVGVAVAVILNADSWDVASALWSDANLRNQMVGVATDIYKTGKPAQTAVAKDKDPMTVLNEGVAKVKDLQDKLSPLPIGWSDATLSVGYRGNNACIGVLQKILGWLFTAIAITLGAPFWFDLLSMFIQLRNSGDPPKPTKPATAT